MNLKRKYDDFKVEIRKKRQHLEIKKSRQMLFKQSLTQGEAFGCLETMKKISTLRRSNPKDWETLSIWLCHLAIQFNNNKVESLEQVFSNPQSCRECRVLFELLASEESAEILDLLLSILVGVTRMKESILNEIFGRNELLLLLDLFRLDNEEVHCNVLWTLANLVQDN